MTEKNNLVLYHGSSNELVGETLNPSQGIDAEERPENNQFGVYATDRKDLAIAMAILGCKDVIGGSIDDYEEGKLNAKIYGDLPKQEHIYVYHLPIKTFKQTKIDKHQFVSLVAVKPNKIEKINVSDFEYLLKRGTEEETKKFIEKYGDSRK